MKVHYINILLFAFTLNTSEHNKRNHNITTYHTSNTKPIKPHRSLCECDLYTSIYHNDLKMKELMENFNRRTSERFHEYDERMEERRKICKEQCDKEIQQIILTDKIQKELTEKLCALQTDITTEDIPRCVCEKSLPDRVEKSCLKCGKNIGGFVPGFGLIGGTTVYAAAVNAATKAGIETSIDGLKAVPGMTKLFGDKISQFVTPTTYDRPMSIVTTILSEKEKLCACPGMESKILCGGMQNEFARTLPSQIANAVNEGVYTAKDTFAAATTPTTFLTNPYIASCIAIMIILAIVLIIYLILRYRRKKKIKKKLQYIKLLKEQT
ncbi:PIR protein, putative [Plasmodium sp.]|nr:PIR protein, putative [Plasmodium sp.]